MTAPVGSWERTRPVDVAQLVRERVATWSRDALPQHAVHLLVQVLEATDRVLAGYGVDETTRTRIAQATLVQVVPDIDAVAEVKRRMVLGRRR